MKVPVLVDDLEETIVEALGRMPNMVYIIDKEGKIAYKADWTELPRIDLLLDELLAEQEAGVGAGLRSSIPCRRSASGSFSSG